MGSERGQGTVEWLGMLCTVAVLLAALVAVGVRVPGTELARAVASRILCAASLADGCGDEPVLIAAYGTEIGKLAREHMPTLFYERGSKAVPVDFRRCRATDCGDVSGEGDVTRTDAGLPVTAFVHAIDCRDGGAEASEAAGTDCSGPRAGHLYLEYFLYFADSATMRDLIGDLGYHHDDWESVAIRIGADGEVEERASSHDGYNYALSVANWGSDLGSAPLREAAEAIGAREENGWGPESRLLLISGGSHAGNAQGIPRFEHVTLGSHVHLIPLEPIAATDDSAFTITPPWQKEVWRDPEATGTG